MTLSEASHKLVIIESLQQVDSEVLEATSGSQLGLINSITRPGLNNEEKRHMSNVSTYTQRLKQLGFSLDTLEDIEPAIFRWMRRLLTGYRRLSLGFVRSNLQNVLSLGADINARWLGLPPLIHLFARFRRIDTVDEEHNKTMMIDIAIALLESGLDPLTRTDGRFSVFDAARYRGWTSELALALQKTGYDLDEVRQKSRLAQWVLFHPGHSLAESTAVDHSQIEPPSTAGLVSRRAVAGDRLEE